MNNKKTFPKILIIQTAFIGDVILATPVVDKLKLFYPSTQIHFLLRKGNEGLLINHPHIDQLLVWNKKKNKIRNLFSLLAQIRREKYDLVVNLQRFSSSGIFTVLSKGKYTIGFDKNPLSFLFSKRIKHLISDKGEGQHEIRRNLALIEDLTDTAVFLPRLYPSDEDFKKISGYKTQPYICIAPASVWFTKQFPESKWIDLVNALPQKYKIYLLGSSQDNKLCERIIKGSKHNNIEDLSGKLSLLESAALIKDAFMNYVNDSAPLHIASSMNAPVCAVYCSTIPGFGFGPLSEKSYVVEIDKPLSCRPCGLHGFRSCPEGHFKCGIEINIEQLLAPIFTINNK